MVRRMAIVFLGVAVCLLATTSFLYAAPFTVTTLADAGAGSLRQAIADADLTADADEIVFSVTGTIALASGLPVITQNLTITGPGVDRLTIDGGDAFRIFVFNSASNDKTLNISGLTVARGNAAGGAGLALGEGDVVNLSDCLFDGNHSTTDGGAIDNPSTVNIQDCIFRENTTTGTGGAVRSLSSLSVVNSIFERNEAKNAGALSAAGSLTVAKSVFEGNKSIGNAGGAVSMSSGAASTLSMTNSTLSGNTAGAGGGVFLSGASVQGTFTNVTFAENGATVGGSSLYLQGGASALMRNTILKPASGSNCNAPVASQGHNIFSDGSCGIITVTDRKNTDPLLAVLADNGGSTKTHALLAGSPAIDGGDDTVCVAELATDQRGAARFDLPDVGATVCDVGAYELGNCGNGLPEAGEACDDGNANDTDACLATCAVASCGDGFIQAGEEDCDGGDDCADDCTLIPSGTTGGGDTGGTSSDDDGGSSGGCSLIR